MLLPPCYSIIYRLSTLNAYFRPTKLEFSGGYESQNLNLQLFPAHNKAQAESLASIGFA